MSALLSRTPPLEVRKIDPGNTGNGGQNRRPNRIAQWMRRHSTTLWTLTPILAIAAVVNSVGIANAPVLRNSEGTLTAYAWAVGHLGQLTPGTYRFTEPPLGWLQIAAWTTLTNGFSRYAVAVLAAREVMVVAALLSAVLLWCLSRRIGFGHAASAIATIAFTLTPVAIELHRTVSLANVATPWLLAALLLATTRRRQLLGFAGSAAAFGVATLSEEAYLVALPVVAYLLWRNAHPQLRRYVLSVATAIFVLIWAVYVVIVLVAPTNGRRDVVPSIAPATWGVLALPIAALVLAGIVNAVVRTVRARDIRARFRIVAAVVVLAVAVTALVPTLGPSLRSLVAGGQPTSATELATQWVGDNVPYHFRLIVDDTMYVDLVESGFSPVNVVRFPALDNDPAIQAQSPNGWKDADYVVSTNSMRMSRSTPSATLAISNSVVVASFGSGGDRVQVRRILSAGLAQSKGALAAEQQQRTMLGRQLTANPMLSANDSVHSVLRSGTVDPRIPLIIGQLASAGTVVVARLPILSGEAGRPVRQVVLSSVDGRPLSSNGAMTAEGRLVARSLTGVFAPQSSTAVSDGLLIRFSVVPPTNLIQ